MDGGSGSNRPNRLDLRSLAAAGLNVAHRLMLQATTAAKKKNDRIDASKI
jgi:hypothetical protein